jgi:excisionase family DNA binding protein
MNDVLAIATKAVQIYAETHPRPVQVTQEQAAEMLSLSRATISRMVAAGHIRLNKFGRIPMAEIDQMLSSIRNG